MTTGPWDKVPVRWQFSSDLIGTPEVGTIRITIAARLVYDNGTDEAVIIPKGRTETVTLDAQGKGSCYLPAVDDPQVTFGLDPDDEDDWGIFVEELFDGGDQYYIYPTLADVAGGFDVGRKVKLTSATNVPDPGIIERGVPGGFAMLDAFGVVINADGTQTASASDLAAVAASVSGLDSTFDGGTL